MKSSTKTRGEARNNRRLSRIKRILPVVVVLLVMLMAFLVHRVGSTIVRIERLDAINQHVARLDELLQDMLNAETGQRGYLLTGRVIYLDPYKESTARLRANLGSLLKAGPDDSVAHDRLSRLAKLVDLKLAELDDTLRLYDNNQRPQALALVQSDLGKLYMDEMRVVVREISAGLLAERSLLAGRINLAAARARLMLIAGTAALLVVVALAVWTVWRTMKVNAGLLLRLEEEATHDALTGLPNRRYLVEWLNQNMAVAARGNTTVGVFFIDLDGFKSINDRAGHEAGDRALQAVAECVRGVLRQSDFAARVGGDEFAVITIDRVGDSSLVRLGERLVEAIGRLDLSPDAPPGSLGASVGIAVFPSDGDTTQKLLEAADAAMYTAKRRGKGQVRMASDTQAARLRG